MKLWQPNKDRITNSAMYKFQNYISQKYDLEFSNYEDLWKWSVEKKEDFWSDLLSFTQLKVQDKKGKVFEEGSDFINSTFFSEYSLNYTENLLNNTNKKQKAIVFCSENKDKVSWDWQELEEKTFQLANYFKEKGLVKGDRVAAYMPNIPETICAFLAAASIGCIFVSCSPDFGVAGVLDRFSQVNPKVLIVCSEYFYGGKRIDVRDKITQIAKQLPTLKIKINFAYPKQKDIPLLGFVSGEDIFKRTISAFDYEAFPFNHPLYILFSSGTTSAPKCITHSTGGALLQHTKELQLHTDVKEGEKIFFYTTCGWMMWNWLVSALASKATVCLYDGSPFYPHMSHLWEYITESEIYIMGLGAKIIDFYRSKKVEIKNSYDLSNLKAILSTASVLSEECFEYIYTDVKSDVHLASMSGGTDIVSCFVLGNPMLPVYRGELQCAGLGMDIDVVDGNEKTTSNKGELVCKTPFPSKPIYFWNDENNKKYRKAYFSKNPNLWVHGDYIKKTKNNGYVIYGRSDATLNPSGIRIGTAEIYRYVNKISEIEESLVVGQSWDGDVRIILFVKMTNQNKLSTFVKEKIEQEIRKNLTIKHLPKKIIAVPDIPKTHNGKITELTVKKIIENQEIKNLETIANPECLGFYKNLQELQT